MDADAFSKSGSGAYAKTQASGSKTQLRKTSASGRAEGLFTEEGLLMESAEEDGEIPNSSAIIPDRSVSYPNVVDDRFSIPVITNARPRWSPPISGLVDSSKENKKNRFKFVLDNYRLGC